jgi:hypothetical protein
MSEEKLYNLLQTTLCLFINKYFNLNEVAFFIEIINSRRLKFDYTDKSPFFGNDLYQDFFIDYDRLLYSDLYNVETMRELSLKILKVNVKPFSFKEDEKIGLAQKVKNLSELKIIDNSEEVFLINLLEDIENFNQIYPNLLVTK